jgi:hypothetical protein
MSRLFLSRNSEGEHGAPGAKNGCTPLHLAGNNSDAHDPSADAVALRLLQAGPEALLMRDSRGRTASEQLLSGGTAGAALLEEMARVRQELEASVSRFCACIGSLCLRHCVHGAPIGDGGGQRAAGDGGARAGPGR